MKPDNDEALLARLAEIEGEHTHRENGVLRLNYGFNPLTNDAQAMALVKNHRLTLCWWDDAPWVNERIRGTWGAETTSEGEERYACEHDPDLNRAVCLAIVAAHRSQS